MALHSLHRAHQVPSVAALSALESALASFRISTQPSTPSGRRNASHQAQGRANGPKDTAGKRLGAKKADGQYVVPGNILFKQRGTLWFPGDGCFMGRDHTIHAQVPGYVKFYTDPVQHPKRKFIGVVFERGNSLPQPHNAVRRRKLGMLAYQMPSTVAEQTAGDLTDLTPSSPAEQSSGAAIPATIVRDQPQEARQTKTIRTRRDGRWVETTLTLRPGHQWRQANWEIGRAAERSKAARSVRPFKPGDRFAAWRKRNARIARNAELRTMKRGGKKGGKAKK
ncbi:54S ribosomal protein L2 mitochondrial [Saxophila tyrrhenica]|uniref:Large ribosomal subunit protein bL27m n=1 Tax=Saxophila tyrrhenica TaxID=1690608 RepID=A0AAV9P174_9PEZI|nr:54S ribosomal protein L2 mitochondrial [Saxophila tyrrhenica]